MAALKKPLNRERVLERAGWVFWRCFASTWALRKEEVFGELVERLTAMGIAPIGAIDRAPSLVEKRTWQPPKADAEVAEEGGLNLAEAVGDLKAV